MSDILHNRLAWNAANDSEQDAVIEQINNQIDDLELIATEEFAGGTESHRIAVFEHKVTTIEFVLIPGEGEISPLFVGRTPVTQKQWDKKKGADKRRRVEEMLPMDYVSYKGVLSWLRKVGPDYRLPNEDEWEYFCRAGTTTKYPWGEEMDDKRCWYEMNSNAVPQPVTEHVQYPNAFGLIDIVGNVSELCDSMWKTGDHLARIHRGGNSNSCANHCTSSCRTRIGIKVACADLGFRVVRDCR